MGAELVRPASESPDPRPRGITTIEEVTDGDRWNEMLLGLPYTDLEQGWECGEILRTSGWGVERRAVLRDGRCIAAVSASIRRLPLAGASIVDVRRGPLLVTKDEQAWTGLMQAIAEIADRARAIFVRLSPSVFHDPTLHDQIVARGFRHLRDEWTTWNPPRIVAVQDITASESDLLARLRKNTRQDVNVARRRGVEVRLARTVDDLHAFHRLLVEMGREKRYPVRGIERLDAIWRYHLAPGRGALLVAERDGVMLGGLVVNAFGRRAYLHYAAVRRDHEKERLPAGPLLYWEFMRWAKARGCEAIDWGGSGTHFPPRREDPGYGVYRFKASFGATLGCAPGYYDLVLRPARYHAFRFAENQLLPAAWHLRALLNR